MSQPIRPYTPSLGGIPPRQAQLLAFIDATLRTRGKFQRASEMRAHMGWKNESSVHDCLDRLIWRGEIRRDGDGPRHTAGYQRIVVAAENAA